MKTSRDHDAAFDYLGVDLTDRYASNLRPIDVCGLACTDGRLEATFWHWTWSALDEPLEVVAGLCESRLAAGDEYPEA